MVSADKKQINTEFAKIKLTNNIVMVYQKAKSVPVSILHLYLKALDFLFYITMYVRCSQNISFNNLCEIILLSAYFGRFS